MNIPQPSKGQPIDSSYIAKIVTAINDITTKISSKFSVSQIYGGGVANNSVRTSDVILAAGYETIRNTASSGTAEVSIVHNFGVTFKYPPVVTATPAISDNTLANKTVSIYTKDVTTSSATIVAKFSTIDTVNVDVNIIAVGLPNI